MHPTAFKAVKIMQTNYLIEARTTYPKTNKHTCIDMPWREFKILRIHG